MRTFVWQDQNGNRNDERNVHDSRAYEGSEKEGDGKAYFLSFLSALVTAYVLAVLINRLGLSSLSSGLKLGFVAWLGFVATVKFTDSLFGGKSWKLFCIDAGHNLAAILVSSAILTLWQ